MWYYYPVFKTIGAIKMERAEYIEINGVKHFFIEYETDGDKPVILYVHGGPGMAESLIGWEIAGRTEKTCNWVFYDQRGAGRTYYNSPDGLVEYEEIYNDLEEIVKNVSERYNKNPFIMGHNWGTIPAIRFVRNNPGLAAGYIGYGQVVDMRNILKIRCARVRELSEKSGSRHDIKVIDKMSAATEGTFSRDLLTQKQITRLNVLFSKYNITSGLDKELMRKIPSSHLYDLSDLRIMMNGPKISYKLNEYMKNINLFEEPMEYGVPMMFITGDWDYQTPYKSAEKYMEEISAPVKNNCIIKDTSFNAMFENADEFWQKIMEFIEENI